jgi:hypothetical protein
MMPMINKMDPVMPRAMRPWKLMFRLKNPAMPHNKLSALEAQIFVL